jgi:hypothetical protein
MRFVRNTVCGVLVMVGLAGSAAAQDEEYVRTCSIYGAGFYYIPGTDVCMRIGGYTRIDVDTRSHDVHSTGSFNVRDFGQTADALKFLASDTRLSFPITRRMGVTGSVVSSYAFDDAVIFLNVDDITPGREGSVKVQSRSSYGFLGGLYFVDPFGMMPNGTNPLPQGSELTVMGGVRQDRNRYIISGVEAGANIRSEITRTVTDPTVQIDLTVPIGGGWRAFGGVAFDFHRDVTLQTGTPLGNTTTVRFDSETSTRVMIGVGTNDVVGAINRMQRNFMP